MALAVSQYQTLQQIGIPVWELRSEQASNAAAVIVDTALDLSNASHIVICEIPKQGSPEQRLLNAILTAIGFPIESVACLMPEQAMFQQTELQDKTVISFGETELETPNLPTLTAQLKQPELKALVWSTLSERLKS